MKKIFMSIIAFAAMAMTMTSCNKDEAINAADFDATFEDTEVMNQVKTHFIGNEQFWDNGDVLYVLDGYKNGAYYAANTTNGVDMHLTLNRVEYGNFNVNNGTLTAYFPTDIVYNRLPNEMRLPSVQNSVAGELTNWPLYGYGTIDAFQWYALCGIVTLNITGDGVAIDSVSITTDKYINGHFRISMSSGSPALSYQSDGYAVKAHGTKTNTVKLANALQTTTTPQEINITIPGGTYNSFNITFYSNGKKVVKRNRTAVTIQRGYFSPMNVNLTNDDFDNYIKGAINVPYNVAADGEDPQNVIFSQGNLEYVTLPHQFWHFADNQWDFRGRYQSKDINSGYDRDLFAWGANGYYVAGNLRSGYGNNIFVWGANNNYNYYNGLTLSGTNEWGANKIANGGNQRDNGWRTLTATEMQNLLNNYSHAMVTLSFVGKKGMIIFPTSVTPVADNSALSKSEWNALEAAGCVFFVADNYRAATGTLASRIPQQGTGSYFWLNTAADANTASALFVDKVEGESIANDVDKKVGGFVRLVKDVD